MFYTQRHEAILSLLQKQSPMSVHALAKALFVSEPTIRRDLQLLEQQGKIKRTFGGALPCETVNREIPLVLRERENRQAKDIIAKQAASYIKDGDVIFLDASSTVCHIIPYLAKYEELTVITNSPKTSLLLAERKIKSFCTGGLLLANSIAYVGEHAQRFISGFYADLFFFSSRGVTDTGMITDSSIEETELRRSMLDNAAKSIFLCDGDKIGHQYMVKLCPLSRIHGMICDKPLPQSLADTLKKS